MGKCFKIISMIYIAILSLIVFRSTNTFIILMATLSLLIQPDEDELNIGDDTPGYAEACRKVTDEQLIDGAIRWFVDVGTYYSSRKDESNPYPYVSIDDFKMKNPNCCSVLPEIPSDYSRETQALGKEKNGYRKLFAVNMEFFENTSENRLKKTNTQLLITCLGKRPNSN